MKTFAVNEKRYLGNQKLKKYIMDGQLDKNRTRLKFTITESLVYDIRSFRNI